jgi:hypothetical protein
LAGVRAESQPRERLRLRSIGHYTGAMVKGGRRKTKAFFTALGACTVALAIALNIGWILLNWRTGVMLALGVLFFGFIISGGFRESGRWCSGQRRR